VKRKKDKQQHKFNSVFASVSEFVVTNKDTANVVRFKAEDVSRPRDILEEQIGETDYEFWGNENIIIPDEPIEKAIIRVGKRNSILSESEIENIRIEDEKIDEKKEEKVPIVDSVNDKVFINEVIEE
jgi:hypothetical protein